MSRPTIGQICECRHSRSSHVRKGDVGSEEKCLKCDCNRFKLTNFFKNKISKKEIDKFIEEKVLELRLNVYKSIEPMIQEFGNNIRDKLKQKRNDNK